MFEVYKHCVFVKFMKFEVAVELCWINNNNNIINSIQFM